MLETSSDNMKQKTLEKITKVSKYPSSHPHQILVNDQLVHLIAGNLLPFSLVESPHFRNFVSSLDPHYQVPSRKFSTTKLIDRKYTEINMHLRELLEQSEQISVTVDVWTNRQMVSFLGMTGHFILSRKWSLTSVLLACNKFTGRHTAPNLLKHFQEVVEKFGITSKVKYVVTDSAANMVKAFSLPGFQKSSLINQPIPQIVDDLTQISNDSSIDSDNEVDVNASFSEEYSDDDQENDTDEDLLVNVDINQLMQDTFRNEKTPFEHHNCFPHVLQLVVHDGFKASDFTTRILKKCSKIIKYVKKSTIATEILENDNKLCIATELDGIHS